MKKVLIGHRGVGKSALLLRHAGYFPEVRHFDLDLEIEKYLKCSIQEFFLQKNEAEFRQLEQEIFRKLIAENQDYVIALGGGFDVGSVPPTVEKTFIRRCTDSDGRIFLNRPRLEPELSPLAEYKLRHEDRENIFLKNADSIYDLSEGLNTADTIERQIVDQSYSVLDAFYTLCRQDLSRIEYRIKTFKNIELRTDLLSGEIIHKILADYPEHRWLVSIRSDSFGYFPEARFRDVDVGFYVEGCQILSSHADDIETGIQQLSEVSESIHLKLCPKIGNFEDLKKGHEWQQADSENRSFLPRSDSGKWNWFRQISKYLQALNFLRNFTQSLDQPSIFEWLVLPQQRPLAWAAVLGSPVHHSRSPVIHKNYFAERKSFFTRIEMTAAELESGLEFVIALGLKYAAVTSPLKEPVYRVAEIKSELAVRLDSANTLFVNDKAVMCENTDLAGFTLLVKNFPAGATVAVWGGGGTLKLMQSLLPEAHFFSNRTRQLRSGISAGLKAYDFLIWAAPRHKELGWPSDHMIVNTVVDLNYTENSPGLEFAARRKISYINGLEMLELQAEKQQEFWSRCERK